MFGDIIDVKEDYDAIGDGASHPLSERYASLAAAQAVYPHATSLTQEIDWAAIQGAINDAGTATFRTLIFMPRGLYFCDTDITLKPGLTIAGCGFGTTLYYTGTGSAFEITGEFGVNTDLVFRDFRLISDTGAIGFALTITYLVSFHNVTVGSFDGNGFTDCGIKLISNTTNNVAYTRLTDCHINTLAGDGIKTTSDWGTTTLSIIGTRIQGNKGWGIYMPAIATTGRMNSFTIHGGGIEGNHKGQLYGDAIYDANIHCYFENAESPTLTIASSSGAVRASNVVTITTSAAHGLAVGDTVRIAGVTNSSFNGSFTVASTPSSTTFTYAQTGSNATSGSGNAYQANAPIVLGRGAACYAVHIAATAMFLINASYALDMNGSEASSGIEFHANSILGIGGKIVAGARMTNVKNFTVGFNPMAGSWVPAVEVGTTAHGVIHDVTQGLDPFTRYVAGGSNLTVIVEGDLQIGGTSYQDSNATRFATVSGVLNLFKGDGTAFGDMKLRRATFTSLPVYANNSAAISGGLVAGNLYRTGGDPDLVCIVH